MDKLEKKTLDVSRGLTYTYYINPAKSGLQTILLVHGFPSTTEDWSGVISDYLLPNGYGILVMDCLGYADSSKPTDMKTYNLQYLAQDIKEILDKESLDKVVCLGHDWCTGIVQRFYNFHPDRVSGLVHVAYLTPRDKFNVDDVIEVTKGIFGYGTHWYWKLFTADDGAQILDSHLESFWTVLHGEPETWLGTLCSLDGLRNFLLADKRQPVQAYATEERKRVWLDQFKRDGFDGPLNYYRSTAFGWQDEANKAIPKDTIRVKVPFLFFGGKRDMVCRPELLQPSIDAGLLPDVTEVVVDTGHWSYLSHPKEFGETVVGWLKSNFSNDDDKVFLLMSEGTYFCVVAPQLFSCSIT